MLHFVVLDILTLMAHGISLHSAHAVFRNDSNARQGSCRIRTVRHAVDERWSGDSMTESFILNDVEYKLCRYQVTWDEAQVFCSTHKSHLATLDSEEKVSSVVEALAASGSVSEGYWIGGKKYYNGIWMWASNSKGLDPGITILDSVPISYPEGDTDEARCLTIDRTGHVVPIFVPTACDQRRGFVCQRDSDRTYDDKIRLVAASHIGEEEFRLYSGRRTWAEAVVQCREEGLQLAEVKSIEEARILAASMLRNRPGIENAWIGGYKRKNEPGTWRWLASGKKIKDNEMWQRNFSKSMGSCLLLDRHLCEIPVYVEANCDRERDVLCQKPPKKHLSKKPVAVVVDGCPYWIGFHPLEWSEARKSCKSMNASLVVLDSPQTISRMMSLMLDSRAELRHVWTSGHRAENGKWEWEVNGEAVPAFGGSFVPWCAEDDLYIDELNCLNLDRENLETPLVYGLSCNQKQPYVCQPYAGTCVDQAITMKKFRFGSTESSTRFETVPTFHKNLYTRLGMTVTMSTMIDDYGNPSTKPPHYFMDESVSKTTSKTRNSLTRTTASSFALPTLPRFGIGVASAMETTTGFFTTREIARNKKLHQLFATTEPVGSSASLATKNAMTTKKKADYSTVDSNSSRPTESTPKSKRTSKIVEPKVVTKTTTVSTSTSLTPEHRRTRKYTQTSGTKPTKLLPKFTKTSEKNEDIYSPINPRRTGSLRRITTPLAKVQKKMRISTTEATTSYDAVDEDYYENYETNRTPESDEETVAEDEYAEEYETPKREGLGERKKSVRKYTEKKGVGKSPVSSIAQALAKNMQFALMDILTKGISDKKNKNEEKASRRPLSDDVLKPPERTATEGLLRVKNKTKNWSLHPYYEFEGPMTVGLFEDPTDDNSEKEINQASKGHIFNFVDKTDVDLSSMNKPEVPKRREYRRNSEQESFNEGSNAPIISSLPQGTLNDPSPVQMRRSLKNDFHPQREPENIAREVEKKRYDEFREKSKQPDERYGFIKHEDPNQHETMEKAHPHESSNIANSPFSNQRSNADEKSWQEVFKITWPEDNSTRLKITLEDTDKNFSTFVRTSRSSKEETELPGFKIPKIIKEIKMDLDQRALRDYLVSLAKKVSKSSDLSSQEDWNDSWKLILGQVTKILDRTNFNVNGELFKVQIIRDDDTRDFQNNSILVSTGRNETKNNLTYGLQIHEHSVDSVSSKDVAGFTESSEFYSDENSMRSSEEDNNSSKRLSQKSSNEADKFFNNATRRAGDSSMYDVEATKPMRKNNLQAHLPQISSINGNVALPGNKFAWYGAKLGNSNNSRILVAPAFVQPVGLSQIYSFQPIVPQLHHRLAFNQAFTKPRVVQRINNGSTGSSVFESEYLPRGTLSKIVGVKYPKRRFPDKIVAKSNFLPLSDSSQENIHFRQRSMINGSLEIPEKLKNKSGEERNNCEGKKIEKRDVTRYKKVDDIELRNRSFESELSPKKNSAVDPQKFNVQGQNRIESYLDNLVEEPSTVSLRMIMNSREKATPIKSYKTFDSSELPDGPRTIKLRLNFSGSKKIANYFRSLENDSRSNSNDGARNISSRVSKQDRRRSMMRKLQKVIGMKNDPRPWMTKSSKRDRNFRALRLSESDEGGMDEKRQVTSLLANLRENNDRLTLYFDLKMRRVVKKSINESRKSET